MFKEVAAFSLVALMCSEKVSFGSKVSPSTLGFLQVGMSWLLMVSDSVLLYSAGSGVKRVDEDLVGFKWRSFSLVHSDRELRYG